MKLSTPWIITTPNREEIRDPGIEIDVSPAEEVSPLQVLLSLPHNAPP